LPGVVKLMLGDMAVGPGMMEGVFPGPQEELTVVVSHW